ncbi:MAG: epoxyqueuosine reductase QueH [Anaerorhabdus sp.]
MINYYQESLKEIEQLKKRQEKARLLIHVCCAPCATFPIQWLNSIFDITIYYANSNIYPLSEYQKRKDELLKYVEVFNNEYNSNVKVIIPKYENENFNDLTKDLAQEKEKGTRCTLCYSIRLEETFKYASDNKFDYVTTAMTISRHKDSQRLNTIGMALENKYQNVRYFKSDFKKKDGQLIASKLSMKYQMYRQDYCGCIYSYQNFLKKD